MKKLWLKFNYWLNECAAGTRGDYVTAKYWADERADLD